MKRLLAITLGTLILISALYVGVSFAISPTEQADIIAHQKLASVVSFLKNNAEDFKIDDPTTLDRATVGEAIINYELAQDYDAKKSLFDQMVPRDDFFNFPVLVDGKIVAEFQLARDPSGRTWDVLIGGDVPQKLQEKGPEVKAALDGQLGERRLLRFGGVATNVVIVRSGSREIGYFPWVKWSMGDASTSLPPDHIFDQKSLKVALSKAQAENKKEAELHKSEVPPELRSAGGGSISPAPAVPQGPVIERLVRYLRYHL